MKNEVLSFGGVLFSVSEAVVIVSDEDLAEAHSVLPPHEKRLPLNATASFELSVTVHLLIVLLVLTGNNVFPPRFIV